MKNYHEETKHTALAQFPNDGHGDWQWWRLVKNAKTMHTDSLSVTPLIKCVDNFSNNRRLALAFEARCGKGRMIMTSMDIISKAEKQPEAAQMLASLLGYMNSSDFDPLTTLNVDALASLFSDKAIKASSDAKDIYN